MQENQQAPLSPLDALSGKTVLLIGTTGFVAKVVLAMLLERLSPKKIYCLIRAQRSKSARQRFFDEVIGSEMMEPLRASFPSFEAYVADRVEPVAGDISHPDLGLDDEDKAKVMREVDIIVNSAGLVTFNPPLDTALDINAKGAEEVARFTASCDHAGLVHISTCFVAGNRSGAVREDQEIVGYFPRQDEKDLAEVRFDYAREMKDLERMAREVKDGTKDAALEARFREEALERLKADGREAKERTLRAAITNQRRRWVAEELVRRGLERAQYWGWPNIYTYTKSLGEQAIAGTEGLRWAIVRPAIVESAYEYPFPGWNEGVNTSAPLCYLGVHGHVIYPTREDLILDVVPVDHVASAIIAAAAALAQGESGQIYQVAAGDTNPHTIGRVVTLVGLYRRRVLKRDEESEEISWWQARLGERVGPLPLSKARYERFSAPTLKRWTQSARGVLDSMEPERYGPLSGIVASARKKAKEIEQDLGKVEDIFEMFMPFIYENAYQFRTRNTRSLFERMNEADRALFPYGVEDMDWRHYWLNVHLPGLEKWTFPSLETQTRRKVQIPPSYRDLVEMFESRTQEHARRVAFRVLREDKVADSYSYRDVRRAAGAVAAFLKAEGVEPKDRVIIASESRPEWGMSYFGVLLAGATSVPVDAELSADEVANLARASKAKGIIASDEVRSRLLERNGEAPKLPPVWSFDQVFAKAHEEVALAPVKRSPESLASIIFTSGTTGRPKGVMLSDRNFTALIARISSVFSLNRTDSLLSVLPLHHTFEFSTGFLLPFSSGASITYLEERTSELLTRAFEETPVTAMVGVPAVWEALHRKIERELKSKGKGVEVLVRGLMWLNRTLRAHTPWNVGRWVLRPMHDALGGRIRWLVSGGAALSPSIFKDFKGIGFSIYEGYGLTEAAPVLSAGRPRKKTPAGSVGTALPGVDLRIHQPDDNGVGQVIARGPTIMSGYLDDEESTLHTLRDGWLFTGDQGRLDEDGNLYIVGRQKDVIVEPSGKNVYPDEIEELYSDSPFIKEMSVVGIPAEPGPGERVAALVVPDYEAEEAKEDELDHNAVRDKIREHFREVGSKQPFHRRVKVMHIWEQDLPRTSTKKIKRPFVQEQLVRLERALSQARLASGDTRADRTEQGVRRAIASIGQRSADSVTSDMRLSELGFDSLMQLELLSAIEAEFPRARVSQDELAQADTVAEVISLAARDRHDDSARAEQVGNKEEDRPVQVPWPLKQAGKGLLGLGQRLTYGRMFDVKVEGQHNVPANTNFIVASNHSSHLDMGLVKYALGDLGSGLVTLAAKDYFFDDKIRRAYFENFTNLLPMDRHGSLKKSMRLATEALRQGNCLLIFPEGTRSRDGVMTSFKPAIGYLSLTEGVDVVPIFLGGTHDALPVGAAVPKDRKLVVRIGHPVRADEMLERTQGWARSDAYRLVATEVEKSVRRLGRLPPMPAEEPRRTSERPEKRQD